MPSRELTGPPFIALGLGGETVAGCLGENDAGRVLQKLTLEAAVVAVCDSGREVVVRKV